MVLSAAGGDRHSEGDINGLFYVLNRHYLFLFFILFIIIINLNGLYTAGGDRESDRRHRRSDEGTDRPLYYVLCIEYTLFIIIIHLNGFIRMI